MLYTVPDALRPVFKARDGFSVMVKPPVSTGLFHAFFSVVLLSLPSTGVAIITLASNLRDAEAVKVTGSPGMQSYRQGHALQSGRQALPPHPERYHHSLRSRALKQPDRSWISDEVKKRYTTLLFAWQQMEPHIRSEEVSWYRNHIAASIVGFIAIFTLVFFTLRRIHQQVVTPLTTMVKVSQAIERGEFHHPLPEVTLPDEPGLLALAFIRMEDA